MDNKRELLIKAMIEKPSTYELEVLNNVMLPINLKNRKTISFTIKPPTIEVLARCAEHTFKIPVEIRESKDLKLEDAVKYKDEMANVIAILAHGSSSKEIPSWYVPFLTRNLEPKDMYMIFYESSLKFQSDFFLSSFQIAKNNPMMMMDSKRK